MSRRKETASTHVSKSLVKEGIRNDATVLLETLRLKKENDELWLCLQLMRDNSELESANLISSIIAWSDDRFRHRFLELNSAFSRQHLAVSPFKPITPVNEDRIEAYKHGVVKNSHTVTADSTKTSTYDYKGAGKRVRESTKITSRNSSPFKNLSPTQGSVYENFNHTSKTASLSNNLPGGSFAPGHGSDSQRNTSQVLKTQKLSSSVASTHTNATKRMPSPASVPPKIGTGEIFQNHDHSAYKLEVKDNYSNVNSLQSRSYSPSTITQARKSRRDSSSVRRDERQHSSLSRQSMSQGRASSPRSVRIYQSQRDGSNVYEYEMFQNFTSNPTVESESILKTSSPHSIQSHQSHYISDDRQPQHEVEKSYIQNIQSYQSQRSEDTRKSYTPSQDVHSSSMLRNRSRSPSPTLIHSYHSGDRNGVYQSDVKRSFTSNQEDPQLYEPRKRSRSPSPVMSSLFQSREGNHVYKHEVQKSYKSGPGVSPPPITKTQNYPVYPLPMQSQHSRELNRVNTSSQSMSPPPKIKESGRSPSPFTIQSHQFQHENPGSYTSHHGASPPPVRSRSPSPVTNHSYQSEGRVQNALIQRRSTSPRSTDSYQSRGGSRDYEHKLPKNFTSSRSVSPPPILKTKNCSSSPKHIQSYQSQDGCHLTSQSRSRSPSPKSVRINESQQYDHQRHVPKSHTPSQASSPPPILKSRSYSPKMQKTGQEDREHSFQQITQERYASQRNSSPSLSGTKVYDTQGNGSRSWQQQEAQGYKTSQRSRSPSTKRDENYARQHETTNMFQQTTHSSSSQAASQLPTEDIRGHSEASFYPKLSTSSSQARESSQMTSTPVFSLNRAVEEEIRRTPTAPPASKYDYTAQSSRQTSPYGGQNEDERSEGILSRGLSSDPPTSSLSIDRNREFQPEQLPHYSEQIKSSFYRPISPSQIQYGQSEIQKMEEKSVHHTSAGSSGFQDMDSYGRYPSTLESNALHSTLNSFVKPMPIYQDELGSDQESYRGGKSRSSTRAGNSPAPNQSPDTDKPMSIKELGLGPSKMSTSPVHGSSPFIPGIGEERVPTPFPEDISSPHSSRQSGSSIGPPIAFSTPLKDQGHRVSPIQEMVEQEVEAKKISSSFVSKNLRSSGPAVRHNFKPTHRLLGEIAFQLERRILDFIFAKRLKGQKEKLHRRFYGYTVSNIPAMIGRESTNKDGSIDRKKRVTYQQRYEEILNTLTPFGYNLEKHSYYCLKMINKYGLLSQPPDNETMHICGLDNPVTLRMFVTDLSQNEKERMNMLVILECLLLLAHDDGQSIFLW